jgi:hypothetical protein
LGMGQTGRKAGLGPQASGQAAQGPGQAPQGSGQGARNQKPVGTSN